VKVIVFSAHGDDIETGMGGLALKLVEAGHDLVSVITTPTGSQIYKDLGASIEVRPHEIRNSHRVLEIAPTLLPFIEQHLTVSLDTREGFMDLIANYRPDAVFTHWGMDVNPDHRATSMLAIGACLQRGMNLELFCFEVFEGVGEPQALGFYPTHYVDVDDVESIKKELVFCHQSQNPEEFWKGQEEVHRNRGMECGATSAEAFVRLTRYGEMLGELSEFFIPTPFRLPRGTGVDAVSKLFEI
jgi:LmbE family N-acetylglucosaminyl deacetylase